jgi:hypothetical protein
MLATLGSLVACNTTAISVLSSLTSTSFTDWLAGSFHRPREPSLITPAPSSNKAISIGVEKLQEVSTSYIVIWHGVTRLRLLTMQQLGYSRKTLKNKIC